MTSLASNPTKSLEQIKTKLASFVPATKTEWKYVETLKRAQELIEEGNLNGLEEIDKCLRDINCENLLFE